MAVCSESRQLSRHILPARDYTELETYKGVFDLRWEWVRELRDMSRFEAKKVDTSENVADILTKCLGGATSSNLIGCVRQRAQAVAAAA